MMMKLKKLFKTVCLLMAMTCTFTLFGCDNNDDPSDDGVDSNKIASPTNFVFDETTGEYSFDGVENAGYYFVKIYAFNEKTQTERNQYLSTTGRISGGTGKKSGTIDVSDIAWGRYNVNVYAYAAAGLGLENADVVTHVIKNGGTLRKPEIRFTTNGTTVEMMVDGYTSAYYAGYQLLTDYTFTVYGSNGSTVVKTIELDSADYEVDDTNLDKGYLFKQHTISTELDAGTYYLSVKANGLGDYIKASEESEKVEFTVSASGEETTYHSAKAGDGSSYMEGEFFSLVSPNISGSQEDLEATYNPKTDKSFKLAVSTQMKMGPMTRTGYRTFTYDDISFNQDGSFVAKGYALFVEITLTANADGTFTVQSDFLDESTAKLNGTWEKDENGAYTFVADAFEDSGGGSGGSGPM